ncbi:GRIP and coiled-coil domain-containing protein 1-like isoform X2 [Babylonia areolata]|uniref:GRIP and coiled-coil domain-containing protein 1-like isoform X2 n=1 Tax=Babylonia areolata TaxID=304850 RepID=UPI003FD3527B
MDLKSDTVTAWSSELSASAAQSYQVYNMDRASRNELVKTIEGLKDQLQTYKNKLRDVVSAYKSLVKEKEALEAGLAALSTSSGTGSKEASPAAAEGVTDGGESPSDPLGVNPPTSEEVTALKDQLKTLTVSLTTLTQEKARVESQFVADNKQLRQEIEDLQDKMDRERQQMLSKKTENDQQIQELKGRIRSQQLEREKEQTDHVVMLREMQKLMAEERSQKEQLELQLDETRRSLQDQTSRSAMSEQYERKIRDLSEELSRVRHRLQEAEVKATQPSSFVLDLQKELSSLKTQHQQAVQQEQCKASEAECRLQQQSKLSEERISSLEDKLSELSEVVGNYERLRFQDQQVIQKLKDRLTQLDVENTALVRAARTFGSMDAAAVGEEGDGLDAQALHDRILHLKTRLLSINQQSETPVDISALFLGSGDQQRDDSDCSLCQQNREELERVREEFERYKLRAQSVLKNKHKFHESLATDSASKEVDVLKDQVSDLRERLKMSTVQHQEEVDQMQTKLDGLSRSMLAQSDSHKVEVTHLKSAHQKEVFVLELEAKKQRERTVALLAEKDQEIEKLRSGTTHKAEHDFFTKLKDLSLESVRDTDGLLRGESSESDDAVARLLMHPASQGGEATILHFAQEKARQDVEMVGLRKQKHQLETALRELQHTMTLKEEKLEVALQELHEQIHKLERDKGREGANLEYLKNVFLKFLTSYDWHGRSQMLRAITTILQFSPAEKDSVRASTHLKL